MLITGENGTGKGSVAQALHAVSAAPRKPLVAGERRRTVGGRVRERAVRPREGRVHRREGGSRRPLRAGRRRHAVPRRDRQYARSACRRSCSACSKPASSSAWAPRGRAASNVRILSATNADLHAEVEAGRFRQDLLFRLNTIEIGLPPLRDRREDIPLLAAPLPAAARTALPQAHQRLRPGGHAASARSRLARQRP